MVGALLAIPESAVSAALRAHQETAMEAKLEDIQRRLQGMRIAPAPTYQAPAGPAPAPLPAAGGAATGAGAAVGAGAGRGGGAGGGGAGRFRRQPTKTERAALRVVLAGTIAHRAPDTPEGRLQHAAQVATWTQRYGNVAQLEITTTGYPLTPGTADPATGECWKCGFRKQPFHGNNRCGAHPQVPQLERRFRSVCGAWLNERVAGVNAVEEVEAGPWYEEVGGTAGGEEAGF
ncbi:hypothetical protein C8R46DRAFT_1215053 [Mycena filopes]|nr:hypothetical protein C8R46DRAFT_1215053 [Mycena filopes]